MTEGIPLRISDRRFWRPSNERCDAEFANGDCTSETWPHRWRGLDSGIIAFGFEADLAVDYNTHAIKPDLPRDFMPFVGGDEAFVPETMLLRGSRIMHTEFVNLAFPVEDQFASVPVHPQIGRVSLGCEAKP